MAAAKQHDTVEAAEHRTGDPVTDVLDEKILAKHDEYEEKVKVKSDYAGAVGKTDPMEKKLVRKLDLWIMVRSKPICLLSSLDLTVAPAYALAHVLAQFPGPQCHYSRAAQRIRGGTRLVQH